MMTKAFAVASIHIRSSRDVCLDMNSHIGAAWVDAKLANGGRVMGIG